MKKVLFKSKFCGLVEMTENAALEHAKWKIRAITMGKDWGERLAIVNACFRGISFSLVDLNIKEG